MVHGEMSPLARTLEFAFILVAVALLLVHAVRFGAADDLIGWWPVPVILGLIAAVGLAQILEGDMVRNYRAMLLPLVVLLTMGLGVIAAIGPVRQGLRIQPIEALRDE